MVGKMESRGKMKENDLQMRKNWKDKQTKRRREEKIEHTLDDALENCIPGAYLIFPNQSHPISHTNK